MTHLMHLDLSNFNTSIVKTMNGMFNNCEKLEYINLKSASINPNIISSNISFNLSSKLTICSENEEWSEIFNISNTTYVNCINNISYYDIYEKRDKMKCFKNNIMELYNPCKFCGNNYFTKSLIKNNITNMNCYEYKEGNFLSLINISNLVGKEEILFGNSKSIIISSTKNKENENKNISINLGQCENILKNASNISTDEPLYIILIISDKEEGMKIPKVQYEVFYPLYNDTFTKLNLSLCEGKKIEILISVQINDNIDKYNPKSGYYNDICYKTTAESGTDISLKDRKKLFIENKMNLCEENCEFISYNYTTKKAKCSCDIKENIKPTDKDFKLKEIKNMFTNMKNTVNINILKCYKTVLNIKALIDNYGFFIMSAINLLLIISKIIFWIKSYKKTKNDLFNMSTILKSIDSNSNKSNENNKSILKKKENSTKKKLKNNKKSKLFKQRKTRNINNSSNNINFSHKNILRNNNNNTNFINDIRQITQDTSSNRLNIVKILKCKSYNLDIKYIKELFEQKEFELNSLEYKDAFKLDKRDFFQYYTSLLKYNHPLFSSFCTYDDYNSQIIKIFLFFFSFSSDLAINALFFNDDTMHKIYQDKGEYNLIYQLPKILLSTLISKIIDTLIKNLALFQDNIVLLKYERNKNKIKKVYDYILKIIKIKFHIFFITAFIILSCFSYYIICFCGIYVNTQIHLIKDSIISFITSLVYSFMIYLIPGIFRVCSLRRKKPNGKMLYKFSSFIENYLI